jgi:hypothetical protein
VAKDLIPREFCVDGPPVSQRARQRHLFHESVEAVRRAAREVMPTATRPYSGPVLLLITYYYDGGEPPAIDVDNFCTPIQNALSGIVYLNDRQVEHCDWRRVPIDQPLRLRYVSTVLAHAFSVGHEFVHVKVDHPQDPQELRQ